jgi:dTDP-glucose 4,6-dehydratase
MPSSLSKQFDKRIVVTGGAGFIGSNLLLHLVPRYPNYLFVNCDCLTYAANPANLAAIESSPNYQFEKIDICSAAALVDCFERHAINAVIHLAAESHVDRSITGPAPFVQTNLIGTFNLLEQARAALGRSAAFRFHHVSTDEVFGSAAEAHAFVENDPYCPNSPYAATKAGADHLVRAYHRTYGLDTVISNSSNNFGPYQFPEKLIPLVIRNAVAGLPIPLYGDGKHRRDWLFVTDHCRALELVFHRGQAGESYVVSSGTELANIELVTTICRRLDKRLGGTPREHQILFVADRPGHDRRYALDAAKIARDLGWRLSFSFDEALDRTIDWYLANTAWVEQCTSGSYREYYAGMYDHRIREAK